MKTTEEILKNILLPQDQDWSIERVICDDEAQEIRICLHYSSATIHVGDCNRSIYDHRPVREWRHLDLWQYKTYILAAVPRYKDDDGKVKSIGVPWACPDARLSWLLEKITSQYCMTAIQAKS